MMFGESMLHPRMYRRRYHVILSGILVSVLGCGSGSAPGPTAPAPPSAGQPVFNRIFFASNRDGGLGDIYSMNLDGSGVKRLTSSTTRKTCPAVSPDGILMAYIEVPQNSLSVRLVIANADGTGSPVFAGLQGGTSNPCPKWATDSKTLLVADQVGNSTSTISNISRFSLSGSLLTSFAQPGYGITSIDDSPSSLHFLFGRIRISPGAPDEEQIVMAKFDGTTQTILAAGASPSWSAARYEVAFACRPTRGLCVMSMNSFIFRRLISGFILHPTFSPDGGIIAYERYEDGPQSDLCLIPPVGGLQSCYQSGQVSGRLSWSLDSQLLTFRCGDGAIVLDICTIKRDGTGFRKIVAHPAEDIDPAFSPIL